MKTFIPDTASLEPQAKQSGSGIGKKNENVIASMLLTLAKAGAYNKAGEIVVGGNVVPESNVVKLIAYVCRPEQLVVGLTEAVSLLEQHGINELPNENVSQIINIQRQRPVRRTPPSSPSPEPSEHSRRSSPVNEPSEHSRRSSPVNEPSEHSRRSSPVNGPDGRNVALPEDESENEEDEENLMAWTTKRKRTWQSLDEPVSKRTRAGKLKKQ